MRPIMLRTHEYLSAHCTQLSEHRRYDMSELDVFVVEQI